MKRSGSPEPALQPSSVWRWAGALVSSASLATACGGSTDTPRPQPGPEPSIPPYFAAPVDTGGAAAVDCEERSDIELRSIEDFELGAAGGWYLSNDVCSVCQEFVNEADAIRNAGEAATRASELAALQADLEACRPGCLAVAEAPYYFDNPPVAEPIPGGRCDSRYAMHVKGGPFVVWGGNMGFGFSPPLNVTDVDVVDPATQEPRPGQDLQGITFWGRLGGSSNNNLRLEVGERHTEQNYTGGPNNGPICTPNTTDDNSELGCDKFGAIAQLREDWQQFLIPFAEMRQAGWGMRAERFDLTGLMSFSIFYAQGTWDFWIDDVAFYRRRP
jgi:hypothetical protein